MLGRPKKTWNYDAVLAWHLTRDKALADEAHHRARRRGHHDPIDAAHFLIETLGIAEAYPANVDSGDGLAMRLRSAEREIASADLVCAADGNFFVDAVLLEWKPRRRSRPAKSHEQLNALAPWIRIVANEPPMDWPDLRAAIDPNFNESDSIEPSAAQRRLLRNAIRFARFEANYLLAEIETTARKLRGDLDADVREALVDHRQRLLALDPARRIANIDAWHAARTGGTSFRQLR